MKTTRSWRVGIKDFLMMPGTRQRPQFKGPNWVIILLCLVSIFFIGVYIYAPRNSAACYIFLSSSCSEYENTPTVPSRELTDEETAAQVVTREILKSPSVISRNPKVAFMFLTPGPLPFEMLWDKFFQGHDGRFTVYVHASREQLGHVSPHFIGRNIRSEKVDWGKISMVDAEKRLLMNALQDENNQHFVLLSDSCVPLHHFDYVYNYLIFTNISFIDSYDDPGPHGAGGRYSEHMLPEIEFKDFRKGSQWFTMTRRHALLIMADSLYYRKFRLFCRPAFEGRNCYADEHYFPTLFKMVDPGGIANWSVTYVDWSERKWHPRSYKPQDITSKLLRNITSFDTCLHFTSDEKKTVLTTPCIWNGMRRPCFLFARKFFPETLDNLMQLFSNSTPV
uniref:glycosyltransferase BC10-like n=1 Tax=Erigeron canadensis TaxID=72917 RepID=UPI001CB92A4A|nr:glycosyltransferase BC10-like [Erigeron canadensis]XP_043637145.1 glycosyltransferase BC10-like [Erigeron canadensis]